MGTRLDLQKKLVNLLGTNNVYFQPPPSLAMKYPALVYNREALEADHADNEVYGLRDRYRVTAIYTDPDSLLPRQLAMLPTSNHERFYTKNNLHHDVFTLYF